MVPFSKPTIDDMLCYVYRDPVVRCNDVDRYINLFHISRRYNVLGLEDVVSRHLRACLRYKKNRLCDVFQQCSPTMPLYQWCLKEIAAAPCRSLLYSRSDSASGKKLGDERDAPVLVLGDVHLQHVLENQDLRISEAKLFDILFLWATNGVDLGRLKNRHLPQNMSDAQWKAVKESHRWMQAMGMTHLINYERIKPSYLTNNVYRSGLVSEDTFFRTFQIQAQEAEDGRLVFDNLRGGFKFNECDKFITEIGVECENIFAEIASSPKQVSGGTAANSKLASATDAQLAKRTAKTPSVANPADSKPVDSKPTENVSAEEKEPSDVRDPKATRDVTASKNDRLCVKVQRLFDPGVSHTHTFRMKKTARMSRVFRRYAKLTKSAPDSLRFLFYGRRVSEDDKPLSMKMNDGDYMEALLWTCGGYK